MDLEGIKLIFTGILGQLLHDSYDIIVLYFGNHRAWDGLWAYRVTANFL